MIKKPDFNRLIAEGRCIICEKKLGENFHFLAPGVKVHKKCLLAYTAWEVEEDYPLESYDPQFYREEQIRRNLVRNTLR